MHKIINEIPRDRQEDGSPCVSANFALNLPGTKRTVVELETAYAARGFRSISQTFLQVQWTSKGERITPTAESLVQTHIVLHEIMDQ